MLEAGCCPRCGISLRAHAYHVCPGRYPVKVPVCSRCGALCPAPDKHQCPTTPMR